MLVEDVPYFYPEQVTAAVEAGLHVYMAKPIAVDVPGCLGVGAAAKQATQKQRCFLVDYQLPRDPACIEVATRVRQGGLGKLAHVASFGVAWHAWPDPPLGKNIESRLRDEIWLSDTALCGDTIVSYDIHIIDAIVFTLGQRPVNACGRSRICRPEPHGDRTDAAAVIYELSDGTLWNHITQSVDNNWTSRRSRPASAGCRPPHTSSMAVRTMSAAAASTTPATSATFSRRALSATSPSSTATSSRGIMKTSLPSEPSMAR